MYAIRTKRAYEKADEKDGFRILVDRSWPRGVKKSDASIDLWLNDVAPSKELRKWFKHDRKKWKEFKKRYYKELDGKSEVVDVIRRKAKQERVTLVYGAKDEECNNAIALKEYISS